MKKVPRILLVEDNEGDAELILEVLQNETVKSELIVISNGEEAISFLSREGKYKDTLLPDLILLDFNLPKVDGKEVLIFVKTHETLKSIPVIMLTTSSLQTDVDCAYNNNANAYIVKSGDLAEFSKTITALENFWIHSVTYAKKS